MFTWLFVIVVACLIASQPECSFIDQFACDTEDLQVLAANNHVKLSRVLGNRTVVYWSVIVISGLLSLYKVMFRDIINNDGILYIDVAKAFLEHGIHGALDTYAWPFYGILIGLVHSITGLGFEKSADSLNALLLMIACVAFVRIYEQICGQDGRIWVAAMLLLAFPLLNDYRDLVVRGYGFWAFVLVALYGFIQYSRSYDLRSALIWQLGITLAILFRLEGLAFLIFAPICLLFFFETRNKIFAHLVRLNGLLLLLAAISVLALLASGGWQFLGNLEMPGQFVYMSPLELFGSLNSEAEMMYARNQFMASADEARLILASGLLMLVIVKVFSNAGLPYLAVLVYGVGRNWLGLTRESYIVAYFAVIGFCTLIPVTGIHFFLSSRYTVLTVLLISLITFQYVDYLLRDLSRRRHHKWTFIAAVIVMALFLDGVISGGASKQNIRELSEWVLAEIPGEETIACNESRLKFYTQDRCRWVTFGDSRPAEVIDNLRIEGYTYLLLWVGRKDAELRLAVENNPALALEKDLQNSKGDSARLYRMVPRV